MLKTYKEVLTQMNEAGKAGIPFLFVLDYEKSEGAIVTNPQEQNDVLFKVGSVSNFEAQPIDDANERITKRQKVFSSMVSGLGSSSKEWKKAGQCSPI